MCVVGVSAISGEGLDVALKHLDDLLKNPNPDACCCKTCETVVSRSSSSLPQWPDYELTEKDGNLTLTRFAPIKNNTECPFAKAAQLWGGKPLKSGSSLKVQAKANYAGLCHFVHECEQGKALDGFCIEIDHPLAQSGTGIQEFGQCVRTMLTCLSDLDPCKEFINACQVHWITWMAIPIWTNGFFCYNLLHLVILSHQVGMCIWYKSSLCTVTTRNVIFPT